MEFSTAIFANGFERLLLTRYESPIVGAERALSFDEPAADDTRTGETPGLYVFIQLTEHVVVVAHVPDGRHPRSDVEQRAILTEMPVHFIKARHQRAAISINQHFAF